MMCAASRASAELPACRSQSRTAPHDQAVDSRRRLGVLVGRAELGQRTRVHHVEQHRPADGEPADCRQQVDEVAVGIGSGFDRLEHVAEGGEAFDGDGSEQAGLVAEELVQGSRRRTGQLGHPAAVTAGTVALEELDTVSTCFAPPPSALGLATEPSWQFQHGVSKQRLETRQLRGSVLLDLAQGAGGDVVDEAAASVLTSARRGGHRGDDSPARRDLGGQVEQLGQRVQPSRPSAWPASS